MWTGKNTTKKSMPFSLVYTFRCICGMRRPTSGMHMRSRVLDAAPVDGRSSRPAALIESDCTSVATLAEELTRPELDLEDQIKTWFEYVANLDSGEAASRPRLSAEERAGTDAGKARLFVALCRSRSIPARIVQGLRVSPKGDQHLHYWVHYWAEGVCCRSLAGRGPLKAGILVCLANSDEYVVWGFGDDLLHMEECTRRRLSGPSRPSTTNRPKTAGSRLPSHVAPSGDECRWPICVPRSKRG